MFEKGVDESVNKGIQYAKGVVQGGDPKISRE